MTLQEMILEAKQTLVTNTTQVRGIIDEFMGKDVPQEKHDEIRKLDDQSDKLQGNILMWEKQLERERKIGEQQRADSTKADKDEGSRTTKPDEDRNKQLREAFDNVLRATNNSERMRPEQAYTDLRRDLAMSTPQNAGYLVVPETFVSEIIKEVDDATFFRQICKKIGPIKGSHSLGYPKRTARASTFQWGSELSTPTKDESLTFGKRNFKPNPATGEIKISNTLLKHLPSIEAFVKQELGYDAAVNLENAYFYGDGIGKPLGVFTASNDGISTTRDVTCLTSSEVKFDDLYDAKYSIKEQYQANLIWIFHRLCIKKIAKLKDNDNQYIWQPSVTLGAPDMLLGKPVKMSEFAPQTFSAGEYIGILGDFKNYWLVDSTNMEIQPLYELYARENMTDYIYRLETDGMPVIDEAFARLKLKP